ncbi:hypothetical protein Anapl_03686 [Anas platyrhynchos]|uniref:Uncharacterized protein n=1 Tax=Anas platyrhynchos TaxID=8839 RepID=R0LXJ9_ANAPL|nr:hypothetical protein Anapl_03686 [Anas platyrhynchos]
MKSWGKQDKAKTRNKQQQRYHKKITAEPPVAVILSAIPSLLENQSLHVSVYAALQKWPLMFNYTLTNPDLALHNSHLASIRLHPDLLSVIWGGDVCVSLERLPTRLRLELSPPPSPKEAATQRRDTLATTSTHGFEMSLQHRF